MNRTIACLALIVGSMTSVQATETPHSKPATTTTLHEKTPPIHVAPADEYFGKLKMSVLGIRNTIKDVGANLDIDQSRWTQLSNKAAYADEATRDWQKKYPHDTWLPKTVFGLERMYAKLDSNEGRWKSLVTMKWLVRDFPKSWYGKTGKKELATGKIGYPKPTPIPVPDTPTNQPDATTATPTVAPTAAPTPAITAPAPNSSPQQ